MNIADIDSKEEVKSKPAKSGQMKGGFFQTLWQLFTGQSDPNREKRRLLRDIAKDLKKTHQKFYMTKSCKALPGMAKFFYEFYKILGPAHTMVQHADSSGALKSLVIESFLEEKQLEMLENFSEEKIIERVKYTDAKNLTEQIKEEMLNFFSIFDADKVKVINGTFNYMQKFLDLIHFDFYFMVKKFDANLPEGNFFYKPSFETINGEYVIDDLKDFIDLSIGFEKPVNWDNIQDILKEYRGNDVVSRNGWKKLIRKMNQAVKSGVFELIIKHIDGDPYYKPTPHFVNNKIVEAYLSKLKSQTEITLQKLAHAKRSQNIEELCVKIFGTASVSRMKNYTEKANETFKKKMSGGYIYVTPINYLKAFLVDFNKKDVREIVDLLIVRGKWTTNLLSQQLSDTFNQLMVMTDRLLEFDESLNDDTQLSTKIKNALLRADKDKKYAGILRQILKEINDQAKKVIFDSAQNLINLGKNLRQLLEDYSKNPHTVIINWKDIDTATDNKIKIQLTEIYKKIYYFIQLLQFYNK